MRFFVLPIRLVALSRLTLRHNFGLERHVVRGTLQLLDILRL
jgi:hypothetical protein